MGLEGRNNATFSINIGYPYKSGKNIFRKTTVPEAAFSKIKIKISRITKSTGLITHLYLI
jgi:hypothetical protein